MLTEDQVQKMSEAARINLYYVAWPAVMEFACAIEQAARREALDRTLEICEEELYAERAAERIRVLAGKKGESSPVYDKSVVKRLAVQMGLIHEIKADTIERCAKVCEDRIMRDNSDEDLLAQRCADAIRALLKSDGN